MKLTIDGTVIEGTAEEIKELADLLGAKLPESAEPTFSAGDRVKTLADGECGDVLAGEVGEITDTDAAEGDESDPYTIRVDTEDDHDYFRPQDLELVTYKPSEGDIVVITANTNHSRNEVGDIGKVGNVYLNTANVDVLERPDSLTVNGNLTKFSEMRPATAEEKAQYEAAVKFAKLGRKPGEFKKGDIVMTHDFDNGHKDVIGEVTSADNSGRPLVKARYKDGRTISLFSQSSLIAPVESRVDL